VRKAYRQNGSLTGGETVTKKWKTVALTDFLDAKQIKAAEALYKDPYTFHKNVVEQILVPNMAEINRKLGQENDAGYLAYAMEFIFMKARAA
jgi:hypothetical protein